MGVLPVADGRVEDPWNPPRICRESGQRTDSDFYLVVDGVGQLPEVLEAILHSSGVTTPTQWRSHPEPLSVPQIVHRLGCLATRHLLYRQKEPEAPIPFVMLAVVIVDRISNAIRAPARPAVSGRRFVFPAV